MNWTKWKMGLLVSLIIGFFAACSAAAILDVHVNLKFVFFFLALVGKDVVLYLTEHPVTSIVEDSASTSKTISADGSTKQVDIAIHKETPVSDLTKI